MKKNVWKRLGVMLAAVILIAAQSVVTFAQTDVLGNTVTNQLLGSESAEYKGRIYYSARGNIYSVKKDGTDKKQVYKGSKYALGFSEIAVYKGNIYAIYDKYQGTDGSNCKLIKVKTNGKGYQELATATSVAVVNGKVYYTKADLIKDTDTQYMQTKAICRMDADGKNVKTLVKKKNIRLLAADGKKLFYCVNDYGACKTTGYCSNLSGKKEVKLFSEKRGIRGYAAEGNDFYYAAETEDLSNKLYKVNISTGKKELVSTIKGFMTNFYVEDGTLYAAYGEEGLKKIDLASGKSKVVNKDVTAGVRGIHGKVMVYEKYEEDFKANTDYSIYLGEKAGKKIKKIGAYFMS